VCGGCCDKALAKIGEPIEDCELHRVRLKVPRGNLRRVQLLERIAARGRHWLGCA
jgi:hypothetical protein